MAFKGALSIAIGLATLLMAPIWVQHLLAADGGLIAIGGGKLTESIIFGDKRMKGIHPIVFHLCAIAGVAHFTLSFLAIAATALGDATLKKVATAIYSAWVACILVLQFTHPWTGSTPDNFMEMPFPLVYVIAIILAGGVMLDANDAPPVKAATYSKKK